MLFFISLCYLSYKFYFLLQLVGIQKKMGLNKEYISISSADTGLSSDIWF